MSSRQRIPIKSKVPRRALLSADDRFFDDFFIIERFNENIAKRESFVDFHLNVTFLNAILQIEILEYLKRLKRDYVLNIHIQML